MLDFIKLGLEWEPTARARQMELAVVLSEWSLKEGIVLTTDYPPVLADPYPTVPFTQAQLDLLYVDIGAGWQLAKDFPGFVTAGFGSVGEVMGGVSTPLVMYTWPNTPVALALVLSSDEALTQINEDRLGGLVLLRTYFNSENGPLAYDRPFVDEEIAALVTWFEEHGIPAAEIAGMMGSTPEQVMASMKLNPRLNFVNALLLATT